MAKITYIEHGGKVHEIEVRSGLTVKDGGVDNNVYGILAECGGGLSCGTCHVYVDPAWVARTGEPSAIERQLIEQWDNPQPNSRLSCQITVSDALDGLVVTVPENTYY
jgi:2Fe-2S ferredoxin